MVPLLGHVLVGCLLANPSISSKTANVVSGRRCWRSLDPPSFSRQASKSSDDINDPPSSSDDDPTIVVVGGGIAGLSLACGIGEIGKYNVKLVEKQPDFTRQGASLSLSPNGAKALRDQGLGDIVDQMKRNGIAINPPVTYYPEKSVLLTWWMLRDALLDRARANEKIRIYNGLEICRIHDDPSSPKAQVFFDKHGEKDHTMLEAELVVGADGLNSQVRSLLGLEPPMHTGRTMLRGHTNPDAAEKLQHLLDRLQVVVTANQCLMNAFSHYSQSPRLLWTLLVPSELAQKDGNNDGDNSDGFASPDKVFENAFRAHVNDEEWETLQLILNSTDTNAIYTSKYRVQHFSPDYLETLQKETNHDGSSRPGWGGKGRVTLIGDAAHALRAATGQGGNLALEDSLALCRLLRKEGVVATQLRGAEFCNKQIVQELEASRLPRVQKIYDNAEESAANFYKGKGMVLWTKQFEKMVYDGI